ncbi:hypothetical protein [Mycetocola miduiensis]|uniref:Uncharacterized protein n=1 Tax=Mycetocola miduiensis TaxID=995034 RepID=A0A1I5ATP1_9MICO|nr:hypothetical protein [Mycetocola miduiensis]SFN65813.1 hypothetical protein SAMN05216219_1535 [Mycetocola miduiensis]
MVSRYADLMKPRADGMWLLSIVGLVLGGIVTLAGLAMLERSGPVALILGVIILAFGAGAFFTNQSRVRQ